MQAKLMITPRYFVVPFLISALASPACAAESQNPNPQNQTGPAYTVQNLNQSQSNNQSAVDTRNALLAAVNQPESADFETEAGGYRVRRTSDMLFVTQVSNSFELQFNLATGAFGVPGYEMTAESSPGSWLFFLDLIISDVKTALNSSAEPAARDDLQHTLNDLNRNRGVEVLNATITFSQFNVSRVLALDRDGDGQADLVQVVRPTPSTWQSGATIYTIHLKSKTLSWKSSGPASIGNVVTRDSRATTGGIFLSNGLALLSFDYWGGALDMAEQLNRNASQTADPAVRNKLTQFEGILRAEAEDHNNFSVSVAGLAGGTAVRNGRDLTITSGSTRYRYSLNLDTGAIQVVTSSGARTSYTGPNDIRTGYDLSLISMADTIGSMLQSAGANLDLTGRGYLRAAQVLVEHYIAAMDRDFSMSSESPQAGYTLLSEQGDVIHLFTAPSALRWREGKTTLLNIETGRLTVTAAVSTQSTVYDPDANPDGYRAELARMLGAVENLLGGADPRLSSYDRAHLYQVRARFDRLLDRPAADAKDFNLNLASLSAGSVKKTGNTVEIQGIGSTSPRYVLNLDSMDVEVFAGIGGHYLNTVKYNPESFSKNMADMTAILEGILAAGRSSLSAQDLGNVRWLKKEMLDRVTYKADRNIYMFHTIDQSGDGKLSDAEKNRVVNQIFASIGARRGQAAYRLEFDPDGDGQINPIDALLHINLINR